MSTSLARGQQLSVDFVCSMNCLLSSTNVDKTGAGQVLIVLRALRETFDVVLQMRCVRRSLQQLLWV